MNTNTISSGFYEREERQRMKNVAIFKLSNMLERMFGLLNLDRLVTGRFSCVLFIVNTDIKANEIKQTTSSYPNR